MSNPSTNREVEIKLWLPYAPRQAAKLLRELGFRVAKRRLFESNVIFDTPDLKLRETLQLIRVRRVGTRSILTYKGPPKPGKHKSREEIETGISDAAHLELILKRLQYQPVFRYEKFRTEYQSKGEPGTITLDETPIGNFFEIEGGPRWIDRMARKLGFTAADYIVKSYGSLYFSYCREHGITPADMTFSIRVKRNLRKKNT